MKYRDVELDLGVQRVEARQHLRQALLRDDRLHADHDRAAEARRGRGGLIARRPHRLQHREPNRATAARACRQPARTGRHRRAALAEPARRAYHRRVRHAGLSVRRLDRPGGACRDTARHRRTPAWRNREDRRSDEAQQWFATTGSEAGILSPQEFADIIRFEHTRLGKLIREAGLRAE
jgi:hypothetical protein